jgi:peptidoglycan/LPS O-acetylase OafA/YrhL
MRKCRDAHRTRELSWRTMRQTRRTRLIISLSIAAVFAFSVYGVEQTEVGSTSAKFWGATALCSAIACLVALGTVGEIKAKLWSTTNADGLLILEALSPGGKQHLI